MPNLSFQIGKKTKHGTTLLKFSLDLAHFLDFKNGLIFEN